VLYAALQPGCCSNPVVLFRSLGTAFFVEQHSERSPSPSAADHGPQQSAANSGTDAFTQHFVECLVGLESVAQQCTEHSQSESQPELEFCEFFNEQPLVRSLGSNAQPRSKFLRLAEPECGINGLAPDVTFA
jgi:hypothetical protein